MSSVKCMYFYELIIFSLILSFAKVSGFIEGLYCGKENCYDVLGVTRDATKGDISKAYRSLARKFHPDMHKKPEDKKLYEVKFQQVATAYEILKDEDQRKDYDYMLDNPEETYRHYYYYYRRRISPKVDVRIVIVVSVAVISIVQYLGAWHRYNSAISYLTTVPKYRIKALDMIKREGLLDTSKKKNRRSKEEIKEEEEAVIKKVIAENMDIRGGYSKPTIWDILVIQFALSPYYLAKYIRWKAEWIWRFSVKKEEYGRDEKLYLIQKYLKCNGTQWEAVSDADKEMYLKKQLWIKEKFEEWKKEQEDEMKIKLAESARYKSYRRYMRNHGPGQICFAD